jgi:hypothetical protein
MSVYIEPKYNGRPTYITRANGMNDSHKYVTAEIYPPSVQEIGDEDVSIFIAVPGSPASGVYIQLVDLESVLNHMGYETTIKRKHDE